MPTLLFLHFLRKNDRGERELKNMKLSVGREAEMSREEENKYWQNVFYKNTNKNKLALKTTKGAINY